METPQPNKWLVTLAVMVPTLIEILDTSVANVALPHIQGSLSAGQDEITWVLTSYLVSNAVVIPMSGWLARAMGRKRYLLVSIAVFIQGIGGGGLQPMSQAILMETFPPEERGVAMGLFGMGIVLGPILGPLVGGYLTDNYTWRWIFYINLPIGLLALVLISAFVFDPSYQERRAAGEKIDYIGLALLCVGIGALQVVLDKGQRDDWFNSSFIVTLTTISVTSLVALVVWELYTDRPILDLRVFADRSFTTGNVVMFFTFFAFFGSIVLLPLFLQELMGYTAYLAGLVLGPGGAVLVIMLPLAGRLTSRIDARKLLAFGLIVTAYSVYYMSEFNGSVDFYHAVMGRVIQSLGMPFVFVSVTFITMAYVPNETMNNASAVFNLLRNLGGSFGIAFVATVLEARTQFHQSRVIESLNSFNPNFAEPVAQLKSYLDLKMGAVAGHTQLAQQALYTQMQRQATVLAFNDAFYLEALILLALVSIVWIMRKPPVGAKAAMPSH
jgi:DHA2 family multidrug resistance protein